MSRASAHEYKTDMHTFELEAGTIQERGEKKTEEKRPVKRVMETSNVLRSSSQGWPSSVYGVLFYMFAGRSRPIILEFEQRRGNDDENDTASSDATKKKNTRAAAKLEERDIVRFTATTPKIPILRVPVASSSQPSTPSPLNNCADGNGNSNASPFTASAVIADSTMRSLHKVILVDVLRRASFDPTENRDYYDNRYDSAHSEDDENNENQKKGRNDEKNQQIPDELHNSSLDLRASETVRRKEVLLASLLKKYGAALECCNESETERAKKNEDNKHKDEDEADAEYEDDTVPEDDGKNKNDNTQSKSNDDLSIANPQSHSLFVGPNQKPLIELGCNDLIITDALKGLMRGKDLTLLAMVPSRDCRPLAHGTAASQRRVNPHKKASTSSEEKGLQRDQRASVRRGESAVHFQDTKQHLGRLIESAGASAATTTTTSLSNSSLAGVRSLRKVIVSSNKKIVAGGSRFYRPAKTEGAFSSANTSCCSSLNNTLNINTINSMREMADPASASTPTSAVTTPRRVVVFGGATYVSGAPSSLFALNSGKSGGMAGNGTRGIATKEGGGGGGLIDHTNPNLMLCPSLEKLLGEMSPFCFCTLDEVYFKAKPSAARGENVDAAAFTALEDLHHQQNESAYQDQEDSKAKETLSGHQQRNTAAAASVYTSLVRVQSQPPKGASVSSSASAQSLTIPPCMLFGRRDQSSLNATSASVRSSSGRAGGNRAEGGKHNDDEEAFDPNAVTARGYPLLMSQHDAFALFNFIEYEKRFLTKPAERKQRERESHKKQALYKKMASAMLAAATTTASRADPRTVHMLGRHGGGSTFREDDQAPLHPLRFFLASHDVGGIAGGGEFSKNERDWAFDLRPVCPLEIHMSWLSATNLWVPKVSSSSSSALKNHPLPSDPHTVGALLKPSSLPASALAQQSVATTHAMTDDELYFASVYNENVTGGPPPALMKPPPPLTFVTTRASQSGIVSTTTTANKEMSQTVDDALKTTTSSFAVLSSPLRRKGQAALLKDPKWGNPYYKMTGTAVLLGKVGLRRIQMMEALEREIAANKEEDKKNKSESKKRETDSANGESPPITSTGPQTAAEKEVSVRNNAVVVVVATKTSNGGATEEEKAQEKRNCAETRPPTPSPQPLLLGEEGNGSIAKNAKVDHFSPLTPSPPPVIQSLDPDALQGRQQQDKHQYQHPSSAVTKKTAGMVHQIGGTINLLNHHHHHRERNTRHPLLHHLLRQRIQDHLDYLATQKECYDRQVIWRGQLEERRILLLSFLKKKEEIEETLTEIENVLFYKRKRFLHSALSASSVRINKPNYTINRGGEAADRPASARAVNQQGAADTPLGTLASQQNPPLSSSYAVDPSFFITPPTRTPPCTASLNESDGAWPRSASQTQRNSRATIEPSPLVRKLRQIMQ